MTEKTRAYAIIWLGSIEDIVLLQVNGNVEILAPIAPALSQIWRCGCASIIHTLIMQCRNSVTDFINSNYLNLLA